MKEYQIWEVVLSNGQIVYEMTYRRDWFNGDPWRPRVRFLTKQQAIDAIELSKTYDHEELSSAVIYESKEPKP